MGNPLRDRRTALELASVGQVIEIDEKISSFESLAGIIEADLAALDADKIPENWRRNPVHGDLEFGFVDAKERIPVVSGSVTAEVGAVCQRCLEPFSLRLHVEPKLLLLSADEVVEGYDEFEVWELDESTIRPWDIVEELLIMALPFSATHDNTKDCRALVFGNADVEDRVRPFAALGRQMIQNEKDPD